MFGIRYFNVQILRSIDYKRWENLSDVHEVMDFCKKRKEVYAGVVMPIGLVRVPGYLPRESRLSHCLDDKRANEVKLGLCTNVMETIS